MAGSVRTLTLTELSKQFSGDAKALEIFLKSKEAEQAKKKIGILAVADVKNNFDKQQSPEGVPWPRPILREGKALLDQGLLRAANYYTVDGDSISLINNRVQARIMQEGGTITARSGLLSIPITAEAKRAGSPRNMPGLHFLGKKGSNKGVLVDRDDQVQYVLKPSVKIPARPFQGFSPKVLDRADQILVDGVLVIMEIK